MFVWNKDPYICDNICEKARTKKDNKNNIKCVGWQGGTKKKKVPKEVYKIKYLNSGFLFFFFC